MQREKRQREEKSPGEEHLRRAAVENRSLEARQVGQGQLQADGEKQQDDADFRKNFDVVGRAYEPQAIGAADHAREQHADQGRNLQAVADKDDHDGQPEDDGDIRE